jgi:hypothetical protein
MIFEKAWQLTAIAALVSCDIVRIGEDSSHAPPRPKGVPAEAIWAGGADGGEFILMRPARNGVYSTKIYNDQIGELEFDGALKLDGPSGPTIDVKDPKTYSGWDGEVMHLRDGRTLRIATK